MSDDKDWKLPGDFTCRGATFRKGVHVSVVIGRMERLFDAAFPGVANLTQEQKDANLKALQAPAGQAFEQLLQAIPKPTPEQRAAQLAASQAAEDMRAKPLLSPQVAALKVIAEDRVTAYQENGLFCVTYRSPSHFRARGAHQSMKQYKSLMAGPISEPEGIPPGEFEAALAKDESSLKRPHSDWITEFCSRYSGAQMVAAGDVLEFLMRLPTSCFMPRRSIENAEILRIAREQDHETDSTDIHDIDIAHIDDKQLISFARAIIEAAERGSR